LEDINRELEGDIMVRQVYDVKGIDMGSGLVRLVVWCPLNGSFSVLRIITVRLTGILSNYCTVH
jgi:hypothetical protein